MNDTAQAAKDLTTRQIERQLRAMRGELFEVVLLDLRESRDGGMKTMTTERLLASIPWLKAKNAHDININIRPVESHLTLLDDLTNPGVKNLALAGYEPCAVVETSPGNFQAWLDHGRPLSDAEATHAAKILARRFGSDLGAAGKRHSGRLAGFTNRKPKHRMENGLFPFVQLHAAKQCTFREAAAFANELKAAVEEDQRRPPVAPVHWPTPQRTKDIAEFHADPRYSGDLSRADYAYCIYAHSHGVSDDAMLENMLRRDLRHKGDQRAQKKYALHTISRARRHANRG